MRKPRWNLGAWKLLPLSRNPEKKRFPGEQNPGWDPKRLHRFGMEVCGISSPWHSQVYGDGGCAETSGVPKSFVGVLQSSGCPGAPSEPASPDPCAPNHTGLSSTKISQGKDGAVAMPRIWEKHREVQHNLSRKKTPKPSSWVLWANPTVTISGGNWNYWGKGPVTNHGGLTGAVTGADILWPCCG